MSVMMRVKRKDDVEQYVFHCPGCKNGHYVIVKGDEKKMPIWGWNGDVDKPTIKPSIITFERIKGKDVTICHSFVTDGKIKFLGDCKHELKNQTVQLEPMEDS